MFWGVWPDSCFILEQASRAFPQSEIRWNLLYQHSSVTNPVNKTFLWLSYGWTCVYVHRIRKCMPSNISSCHRHWSSKSLPPCWHCSYNRRRPFHYLTVTDWTNRHIWLHQPGFDGWPPQNQSPSLNSTKWSLIQQHEWTLPPHCKCCSKCSSRCFPDTRIISWSQLSISQTTHFHCIDAPATRPYHLHSHV